VDRLAAPGDLELAHDVADVELGRRLGDEQGLADLPVGQAEELRGSNAFSPRCTARIARSSPEVSTSVTT
jgi:hypothetical protein